MENSLIESIESRVIPPVGGAYSQAVRAGDLIFTAGWGPHDPGTGRAPDGVEAQTRQLLANLQAFLTELGATTGDVVKSTVHLQNLERDFARFNSAYAAVFHPPYPARTTVGATLGGGTLVEMDFIISAPRV